MGFGPGSTRDVQESAGTVPLTVELSEPAAWTITVAYAASVGTATSADYILAPGMLTFAPGETSKVWVECCSRHAHVRR